MTRSGESQIRSGPMADSPIAQLLAAVDKLDVEAATALFTPDARLLTADGRQAAGIEDVRQLLGDVLGGLRSTSHQITAEWHEADTWIAEVSATYELEDWLQTSPLPRAIVLRQGPDGIVDLRIYGAHERQLADHGQSGLATFVRGRWIPPL
jgi:ketosteroid isomerase-like protein